MDNHKCITELNLNFGLDGISPTGQVYDIPNLLYQINKMVQEKNLFVYRQPRFGSNSEQDVVGIVTSSRTDYNNIYFEVIIDDPTLTELINTTKASLSVTTMGIGALGPNSKVENFKLEGIFPTITVDEYV
jgi:hypothetical protein